MSDRQQAVNCFNPSPDDVVELEATAGWKQTWHQFDSESIWAVRAALATGRPLLIRGEPGTGKSQLARAVAAKMDRPLLYEVVNSRTEVTDLLFRFDAVARLAEAQILGASKTKTEEEVQAALGPHKFVCPGKIWWAMNWETAEKQAKESKANIPPDGAQALENGCVLLVDEIDKADSELPNALLECFANQSFQVPHLKDPVTPHPAQPSPLVVVTTNEERELPAPFLRRCFVLQMRLPGDDAKMTEFLVKRGEVHFKTEFSEISGYRQVLEGAAEQLIKDRKNLDQHVVHRPGQAEYLDLCRAAFEIAKTGECGTAAEILENVATYALHKNAVE